jgi:hypothetical protein
MKVEPQRLVFIDETWIKTNMAPLRGWAPRGKRLRAYAPFGHWKTLTFIAALRCDRMEAPFVLDGPINGQAFRLYVETQLAPTLRPGDVVVMDNLGSHKGRHPKPRRSSALPAGLQPGPEPHRAGLRQAQAPHTQVPAQRRRGRVANGRTNPRALHTQGMRQLPRQRRIRFCLITVRSKGARLRLCAAGWSQRVHSRQDHRGRTAVGRSPEARVRRLRTPVGPNGRVTSLRP